MVRWSYYWLKINIQRKTVNALRLTNPLSGCVTLSCVKKTESELAWTQNWSNKLSKIITLLYFLAAALRFILSLTISVFSWSKCFMCIHFHIYAVQLCSHLYWSMNCMCTLSIFVFISPLDVGTWSSTFARFLQRQNRCRKCSVVWLTLIHWLILSVLSARHWWRTYSDPLLKVTTI